MSGATEWYVLEMGKREHKLGQNIIPQEKEDRDFGMVIQDNLSPEEYIDNISTASHFLDKDSIRKI